MNFLIMWAVSVIASYGMEVAFELKMYKDAADNGYKINNKKISDYTKQFNGYNINKSKIFLEKK